MSRRANTNYTAGGTDFDVVVGNEPFLMADIQRVQAALEGHDHSATKGLPVARVGNGSIGTTQLADLSVTAAKIALGAVGISQLTAETPRFVTGSFTGNGSSSRTIPLSFTPKLVFLTSTTSGPQQGIALYIGSVTMVLTDNVEIGEAFSTPSDGSNVIVSGGFKVSITVPTGGIFKTNTNGVLYNYIAFG